MRNYSDPSGPCFDGRCEVELDRHVTKLVEDIVKGDTVCTPNGVATVRCVVKTIKENGKETLVELDSGLLVTRMHPIRVDGRWINPCELSDATLRECPAVYSFLLEESAEHVMIIDGIECICLAHNNEDPGAMHPYFGTNLVVNDLSTMEGWDEGYVILQDGCMERDKDGYVCKLVQ